MHGHAEMDVVIWLI